MRHITITEYPSMRGRYKIVLAGDGSRPVVRDANGAGAAAAVALQSTSIGVGDYVIVGPEAVLEHIPAQLRFSISGSQP